MAACLLSLFNLPTLANLNPPNMAVFVFDNQAYSGTRISYPSATAGKTDLAAMASGAGIEHAVTVSELAGVQERSDGCPNTIRIAFCRLQNRREFWPSRDHAEQRRLAGNQIPLRALS